MTSTNGKVASFTGKTIQPGQWAPYNDEDGNERRAKHGAEIPVEKVSNIDHLVDRGIVVVKTPAAATTKETSKK